MGGSRGEHGNPAPVRDRDHDLLGAHRPGAGEHLRQRQLAEHDLAPVGEAAGGDLPELLGRAARRAQALGEAPRLAVDRHRAPAADIEHQDTDRRGLDQGLEVGARPLLVAMGAGVGDGSGRLRGEQHQHLLILGGELGAVLLLSPHPQGRGHIP